MSTKIKALLFDFNGVLVDDEPIHLDMFRKVLNEEGIGLSTKDYYRLYLGMNDEDCFKAVLRKGRRKPTPRVLRDLIRRKAGYYRAYITRHPIYFSGAAALVRKVAKTYPLAIVSGALRSEILYLLRKEKLRRYFSVIVAAEDIKRGKPHPDGFSKALRLLNKKYRLRIKPEECLAIEDSKEGIAAAKKAGMICIALTTSHPSKKLRKADYVVPNVGAIAKVLHTLGARHPVYSL
jgi:beta-phosphoglucomutase